MAWSEVETPSISGKPKIAIAICHTGEATMEWFERCYGPLRFIGVPWCDKVPHLCRGVPIAVCRNKLVEDALKEGCTHVFFIDSDHVPEMPPDPNEALRLLYECDTDMVTALYRAKKKTGYPYNIWKKVEGGYEQISKWTGNFFKIDVAGIGNSLIKREVFEKVPTPWFVWDREAPSEDFAFFEKCAKYGFRLHCFSEVRFSHIGTMAVQTDGKIRMLRV